MKSILWRWFGLKKLKGLLDKIPANGRKTVIGGLITVLGVAGMYFPEYSGLIDQTLEFLRASFEVQPVVTTGTVVTGIGVLHKVLKALERLLEVVEKEEKDLEEEKDSNDASN
jgi:hypothetical protein